MNTGNGRTPEARLDGELQARFAAQRRAFEAETYPSLLGAPRSARSTARADRAQRGRDRRGDRRRLRHALVARNAAGRAVHGDSRHPPRPPASRALDAAATRADAAVPAAGEKPAHPPAARCRRRDQPVELSVQLAIRPWSGRSRPATACCSSPVELTPQTSALLAELVGANFAADEFAVVNGDADIGGLFAELPFDHLFFTGSTAVGRKIALAAAENLTPVTLELGGKSPALVHEDADIAALAPRLGRRQAAQRGADVHCARLRARACCARRCAGAGHWC